MKGLPKSNTHFINTIIHNKVILYVILFASLINMTAYGLMGDITTPLIFVLVGIITAYYNKNMIVILVVALAVSNVLKCGTQIALNTEGFTEGLESTTKKEDGTGEDGTGEDGTGKKGMGKDDINELTKMLMETDGTKNIKDEKIKRNLDGMTEEEKEQMKEFLVMKNKVVEIIDGVEKSIEKLNKNMSDLQKKVAKKGEEIEKDEATTKDKKTKPTNDKEEETNSFANPYTSK